MKVSDGKRMKKVNQPALHRLRHTENTQLKEIADFIHNLAFSPNDKTTVVSLSAEIQNVFSQLPLSLYVGELLLMCPPNFLQQSDEFTLRYSFVTPETKASVKTPNSPQIPAKQEQTQISQHFPSGPMEVNQPFSIAQAVSSHPSIVPNIQPLQIPQPVAKDYIMPPTQMPPVSRQPQISIARPQDSLAFDMTLTREMPSSSILSGFSLYNDSFGLIDQIRPPVQSNDKTNRSENPSAASLKNSLEQLMQKKN